MLIIKKKELYNIKPILGFFLPDSAERKETLEFFNLNRTAVCESLFKRMIQGVIGYLNNRIVLAELVLRKDLPQHALISPEHNQLILINSPQKLI